MSFFGGALDQAWKLVIHRDPFVMQVTWITIKVATIPTVLAAVLGLPLGIALGIGRFRGRGPLLVIANAGLGLPPIIVGLVLVLLLFPAGPLGGSQLLFTLHGVYLAQTILAFPILVALTASAVRSLPTGLLDQARAFGAGRIQLSILAVREARIGILAALIAAIGSALSEVGAIVLVGGNFDGVDQTLATATLASVNTGNFTRALAIGMVLLALIILVSLVFTVLQYFGGRAPRIRQTPRIRQPT